MKGGATLTEADRNQMEVVEGTQKNAPQHRRSANQAGWCQEAGGVFSPQDHVSPKRRVGHGRR